MKAIRSDKKLIIEIEEDNEGVEIVFPNVFRAYYGFSKFEIVADDLRYILGTTEHHLTRLALNAIDAERYAEMTGKPRWLLYDPESGSSYEGPYPVEGALRVEYINGKVVWVNREGGG